MGFNNLKIYIFFCSVWAFGLKLPAQDLMTGKPADEKVRSEKAIQALKNGVLIVSIPGNHNKITYLQKLAENTKGAQKARFEQILQETVYETNRTALGIVKAIDSSYNFSPVLFMYDTATTLLKNGRRSGFFLDKSLRIDTTISLGDRPFLVFKQNPFADNWLMMDDSFKLLNPPFPYKTPGRRILIFRLSMNFTIKYINKELKEFYKTTE